MPKIRSHLPRVPSLEVHSWSRFRSCRAAAPCGRNTPWHRNDCCREWLPLQCQFSLPCRSPLAWLRQCRFVPLNCVRPRPRTRGLHRRLRALPSGSRPEWSASPRIRVLVGRRANGFRTDLRTRANRSAGRRPLATCRIARKWRLPTPVALLRPRGFLRRIRSCYPSCAACVIAAILSAKRTWLSSWGA